MGCTNSIVSFVVDDDIPGQDNNALIVFKELEFEAQDIDKLYTIFRKMDRDLSGSISTDEIFKEFNMRGNSLEFKIFEYFDEGKKLN